MLPTNGRFWDRDYPGYSSQVLLFCDKISRIDLRGNRILLMIVSRSAQLALA